MLLTLRRTIHEEFWSGQVNKLMHVGTMGTWALAPPSFSSHLPYLNQGGGHPILKSQPGLEGIFLLYTW